MQYFIQTSRVSDGSTMRRLAGVIYRKAGGNVQQGTNSGRMRAHSKPLLATRSNQRVCVKVCSS